MLVSFAATRANAIALAGPKVSICDSRRNGQLMAWLLLVPMCADVQITLRQGPSISWTLS
jgi:hypothetical protein